MEINGFKEKLSNSEEKLYIQVREIGKNLISLEHFIETQRRQKI